MPKSSMAIPIPSPFSRSECECGFDVADQDTFANLEFEQTRIHAGEVEHRSYILQEPFVGELACSEIHGNVQRRRSGLLPGDILATRRLDHPPAIGKISPVSSAIGMNCIGASNPRSGCSQRSSASMPVM